MIALGGPKLKLDLSAAAVRWRLVSMIALGGPKLKLNDDILPILLAPVSMIALGGPKLKLTYTSPTESVTFLFQ